MILMFLFWISWLPFIFAIILIHIGAFPCFLSFLSSSTFSSFTTKPQMDTSHIYTAALALVCSIFPRFLPPLVSHAFQGPPFNLIYQLADFFTTFPCCEQHSLLPRLNPTWCNQNIVPWRSFLTHLSSIPSLLVCYFLERSRACFCLFWTFIYSLRVNRSLWNLCLLVITSHRLQVMLFLFICMVLEAVWKDYISECNH